MAELIDLITSNFDYDNFFSAKLTAPLTATDTDIFLDNIPTPSEGVLVIDWDVADSREVIFYNSKTASKVVVPSTAERGFDDSTATTHLSGANVIYAPVRALFRLAQQLATTSEQGWKTVGYSPNTITHNGQRSYSLVFNSVDLTSFLNNGMRLRIPRTATAPTQCTDLEASSTQYWSKTSPAGCTFTDDFTCMAWVKPESYDNAQGCVISRYNGTSGWQMRISAGGVPSIYGFNAGSTNYRGWKSYESVQLNRWTHLATTLNMSASTGAIYFNGIEVGGELDQSGTNPTALIQAGNLEVGARNAGTVPFDGKLAQVAVFSSVLSAGTIQQYMNQTLSGSESTLISAYSFDGTANDLNTTNANNLTAQNSAGYTSDSPFALGSESMDTDGTTDYGVITKIAFATNTTVEVFVPEGCTIPTTGGVGTLSYSTFDAPYGFPRNRGKWEIVHLGLLSSIYSQTVALNTFEVSGAKLLVPVGAWRLMYQGTLGQTNGSAGAYAPYTALSTSTTIPTIYEMVSSAVSRTSGTSEERFDVYKSCYVENSTATNYYQIVTSGTGAGTITVRLACNLDFGTSIFSGWVIKAECAYV